MLSSYQDFLSFAAGIDGPNVSDYHRCSILAVFVVDFLPGLCYSQYHNFQLFYLVWAIYMLLKVICYQNYLSMVFHPSGTAVSS